MRYAGRSDMGHTMLPFQFSNKRKRDSANYWIMSFILFPEVLRRGSGWVIITVTSFPSLTDILDCGARGNVAECTLELKQSILRGFRNVFIGQLEEYWLNRGLRECMKNIWDNLKVVSIFDSCHGVMVIVRVGSPLWLKDDFTDTCYERGEGAFSIFPLRSQEFLSWIVTTRLFSYFIHSNRIMRP